MNKKRTYEELEHEVARLHKEICKKESDISEIQELAKIGNWEWDIKQDTLIWSNEVYRIFGLDPAEFKISVKRFEAAIHPDDRENFFRQRERMLKEEKKACIDHRIVLPDGSIRYVQERAKLLFDQNNNLCRVIGTVQDITESQKTESQLQLFKAIVESSRESIAISDLNGQLVYINAAHEKLFGHSLEEARKLNYRDYYPPKSIEILNNIVVPAIKKGYSWEGILDAFDAKGRLFPLWERTGTVFDSKGNMLYGFGFMHDETERITKEQMVKDSEERYRSLFESMTEGVCEHELVYDDKGIPVDYRIIGINPAYSKHTNITKEEAIGKTSCEVYKTDTPPYLETFVKVVTSREPTHFQIFFEPMDKYFDISVFAHGKNGFATVFIDITERKHAAKKIQSQSRLLDLIFEHSLDSIVLMDAKYNFIRVSETYAKACQRDSSEFPGHNHFEFYPSNLKDEFDEALKEKKIYQRRARPFIFPDHPEWGTMYWNLGLVPIMNTTGDIELLLFTLKDVTEIKQTEAKIHQLEKSESLMRMAGAVAHLYNNMLTVVLGNLEMVIANLSENFSHVICANEAMRAASRASDIGKLMLAYLGNTVAQQYPIDICKLCLNYCNNNKKLAIQTDIPSDGIIITANSDQIRQVLNSIIDNAMESINQTEIVGIISLRILIVSPDHIPSVRFPIDFQVLPKRYVGIEITDNGSGISEKNIEKIFDPFFSTKFVGRGLGISVALGIIKQHDGCITVKSTLDHGSTFCIYLPVKDIKHAIKQGIEQKKEPVDHKGHGKILLMDDQEMILNMAGRLFKLIGYETDLAKDGKEAIEMYKQAFISEHPYDLVVLDLTVPDGMGGLETIQELLKFDSKVKAIISSGYSNDPIMANYHDYGFCGVIPKPYTKADISETLNKIVSKPKSQISSIPSPCRLR
ncbi:MAG: PAS domain S-box protein [Desulfobacterales bacterium]|nr:PAS domain S-box protein [Desulfobacterales bacterium]